MKLDVESFVVAAASAQGMELTAEQVRRVAEVFARNVELARLVIELDLPESVEPAPVFNP
jgi:hypothetical protein